MFIALQSVFFSCKYRKTPVFTGKKSFIALGSDVKSSCHYLSVPRSAPLRATVVGTALEIFLVPSERSGTLSTMMRIAQEHCDFSS